MLKDIRDLSVTSKDKAHFTYISVYVATCDLVSLGPKMTLKPILQGYMGLHKHPNGSHIHVR